MNHGAFVLKMQMSKWRLCVVKQVPEQSSSCWMLFGQNRKTKTTFQMEFQPHQNATLINHLTDMADTETEIRLVLVSESPAVSCIESLWSLQGQEMYRKKVHSGSLLINSLHQDLVMLSISPQMESPCQRQEQIKHASHSMQTRSQTKTK
jgi:hypothetical protein